MSVAADRSGWFVNSTVGSSRPRSVATLQGQRGACSLPTRSAARPRAHGKRMELVRPLPPAARDRRHFTEMQKAKIAARFMTTNAALGIPSFWNETFQTHMTSRDVSLLRSTFSADPISPAQPQPIYYVLRTPATALADVR